MKIELWYDAVARETDILINGIPVEKNDVYGFLYPVRNYPIQSWLYPNGSWKGIEYQIEDLARDETVELVFHGRKTDYDDICKCLSESSIITPSFIEWDICKRYDELFSNLFSTLKSNDATMRRLLSTLKSSFTYKVNFDVSVTDSNWAYHIYNDEDLDKAGETSEKSCCFVHDSFFTSYDKLQELLALTRSLLIPADAIYCCFKNPQTQQEYEYYAESFKRMAFRFCSETKNFSEDAKNKYGLPALVKSKIEKCGEISKVLCSAYSDIKESTTEEFAKLKKNVVSLNEQERKRFQNIKLLRDNADRFKHGMELIYKYIDILLSVSKENKEEVFHYECIDKLYENISLYLNVKSFGEVN